MLRETEKQLSFHSMLYNKIPEDHLLKVIDRAVDFSFINEMVAGSYCREFGRPAKEPEMMAKLLFLEHIYDLSDVKIIERGNYDLAFLWFLGLNPEEELPDPSLLAKFRTQRLQETTLDDILSEIIRQCVEKGIIKGNSLSVDTTHILANTTKKVPERVMKHLAKRIFKGLQKDIGFIPEDISTELPDYKQIENHLEAKVVMKAALETVMEAASPYAGEKTEAAIEEAKEILSDEKFLLQKGVRSLSDKDARVGSKSKTDQFFGYKAEFTMTTDERLITAIDVHSGEYVDGKEFSPLLERTQESGVEVKELLGDKAYFRKDILEELDAKKIKGYIPVSASVYKVDEQLFAYNKDSDQWFCFMGNYTVSCKKTKNRNSRGDEFNQLSYLFKKEQCANCPHRARCMGKGGGKKTARKLVVGLSAPLFYEKSQEQKTPEFQEKYKRRAAQEWKNGEMKRFHGMDRARGWGKRSACFQAKITAIAVNLKRIAALWQDMELAEAQAALRPKSFPQSTPPDECQGILAPIWEESKGSTLLFAPIFSLFSAICTQN